MSFNFSQAALHPDDIKGCHDVIDNLWDLVRDLKEKLGTNSKNSSKRPSSEIDKPATSKTNSPKEKSKNKRKQGAQKGHNKHTRELVPIETVDHIKKCPPKRQCDCNGLVIPTGQYSRKQKFDFPVIKPIVTEYQLQEGTCSCCSKRHVGQLPDRIPSFILGPRGIALVGTLTGCYRISKRNVVALFHDIYNFKISSGSICKAEKLVSAALERPVEAAKHFIKDKQTEVHADETGHKEKGKRMRAWVAVACMISIFIIRPSRGRKSAEELLGSEFAGILITDRWSAYSWVKTSHRQVCWAHLLRDFQKISERHGQSNIIGNALIKLTNQMFRYWHKMKTGVKSRDQFEKYMGAKIPEFEYLFKRGRRCKNKKTKGTCKEILKIKEALWTFVYKESVEPTNNLAERTIRTHVIWNKTSFGTQSTGGTLYMERILTVVGSCKLQGMNVLDYLSEAVTSYYNDKQYPSLIPGKYSVAFAEAV